MGSCSLIMDDARAESLNACVLVSVGGICHFQVWSSRLLQAISCSLIMDDAQGASLSARVLVSMGDIHFFECGVVNCMKACHVQGLWTSRGPRV